MKKLSYRQALAILLAVCACGLYLWFFWRRVLPFYGVTSPLLFIVATLACLAIGLIDPIPIKLRTVVMMYIGFYGILTDAVLWLIAPDALWQPRSGLLVAALTILSLLYGYYHGKKTAQTHYSVPSPLSAPLRIALLSDIHMGKTVDEARLRQVLSCIEIEKPDLLIVAGDLCDEETTLDSMYRTARALGGLLFPTYVVLGNHDLGFRGKPMQFAEKDYRDALAESGVRLLDDEMVDLGDYCLLGRRDRWVEGRLSADELPRPTKPCILIDHQPFDYKENAALGAFLQLSGHTHAAQVFPLSWMGRVIPGFYGRHRHKGLTLLTSCGLGNRGNKLRSGCTAEYVIIDLIPHEGA